jgi:hypothetical protein
MFALLDVGSFLNIYSQNCKQSIATHPLGVFSMLSTPPEGQTRISHVNNNITRPGLTQCFRAVNETSPCLAIAICYN